MNTKKVVTLSFVISFAFAAICFFIIESSVKKERPAKQSDYEQLYEMAILFDEQYRGEVNSDIEKLTSEFAEDYIEEDDKVEIMFENDKCYLILEYDEKRNFIRGKQYDKCLTGGNVHFNAIMVAALVFIISYLITFSSLYENIRQQEVEK